MVASVVKSKSRSSKMTKDPRLFICNNICSVLFRSFLYLILLTILSLFLLYLWLSFTTIVSDNVLHVCVFTRKLNNDPQCLTVGFQSPNNLTKSIVLGNGKMVSETLTGVIPGDRVSDDLNKALRSQDEMGSRTNSTLAGDAGGDRVFDEKEFVVHKHKNISSVLGDIDGEMSSQKNNTFAGETAEDRVSGDPTKILRSEDKKEYNVLDQKENLNSLIDREVEEEYSKFIKPKTQGEGHMLRTLTKYLYLQRSWQSPGNYNGNTQRSCEGKGVYVYDLPSRFNRDLLVNCSDILPWANLCSYFKNEGFGEVIKNLGHDWFETHMYSLEPILHARVLKHPCRVYNESQAKLFYVPYYGGFDVLRWHFRNVNNDVKDRLGLEVLNWLESKESWRRNTGKDHVFVLGKITWDFRRTQGLWGSRFLELQEIQNPTKLLIERQPWQINDIAIPHPTYFHPKTDDDITNWQVKIMSKPRQILVSFAGAPRPGNPNNIRLTLFQQCAFSDHCRFLDCNTGSCKNPKNIIALFQDSEFCLQPPGDSATRKSVFDSLISGCIPVIFNPYTAYFQYTWHLPEDHSRYSVYISEEDVKEKRVNVMETLMAKTLKEKEDMRSYIVYKLLPGLLYGDPNAKFEKFRDAFDITFDNLIEKINKSK